jgi:hypothetical protein
MKKLILLALAAPSLATAASDDTASLRDAALADTVAWDITEGLTTEIGPRQAGTEAEARARDWGKAKLEALGFRNVRIETCEMPVWDARSGKRIDHRPLPRQARDHRARQQWRDSRQGYRGGGRPFRDARRPRGRSDGQPDRARSPLSAMR